LARRACTLFSVARSALSYQDRKAVKDAPVVERMKELSGQYPRYGHRRVRIFLGRDGYGMSPGRAHRLWRAADLQVPRKRPRKRVAAARGRKRRAGQIRFGSIVVLRASSSKCLTITDEFTKEGLAMTSTAASARGSQSDRRSVEGRPSTRAAKAVAAAPRCS
jgi:putative transposase